MVKQNVSGLGNWVSDKRQSAPEILKMKKYLLIPQNQFEILIWRIHLSINIQKITTAYDNFLKNIIALLKHLMIFNWNCERPQRARI